MVLYMHLNCLLHQEASFFLIKEKGIIAHRRSDHCTKQNWTRRGKSTSPCSTKTVLTLSPMEERSKLKRGYFLSFFYSVLLIWMVWSSLWSTIDFVVKNLTFLKSTTTCMTCTSLVLGCDGQSLILKAKAGAIFFVNGPCFSYRRKTARIVTAT